jgi:hypothetical protein
MLAIGGNPVGLVGTGPGPLYAPDDAKLIALAANIKVRTIKRIAIFIIYFLQFCFQNCVRLPNRVQEKIEHATNNCNPIGFSRIYAPLTCPTANSVLLASHLNHVAKEHEFRNLGWLTLHFYAFRPKALLVSFRQSALFHFWNNCTELVYGRDSNNRLL